MKTKSGMVHRFFVPVLIFGLVLISAPVLSQEEPTAPQLENLGDYSREITTSSELAQEYFDQGLNLHYGFNHIEAIRSFEQAQRLDPTCAMAYWGEALSRGPHLNAAMAHASVAPALDAIRKAKELAGSATQQEQDFIEALAARYGEESTDVGAFDQAYADAMREVAAKYPDDPDAQALFAEALMVTSRWDYWQPNGEPKPVGEEIVSTLEKSFERDPNHPGTNHFYIHTVEPMHPSRGEEAADRLAEHAPEIGHLLHMPSHIYLQIGRYANASTANEKAVATDREYHQEYGARGMYRISYMPHNSIYLCNTTMMEGRTEACLQAAQTTRDLILWDQLIAPGYGSLTQGYALRYQVMAQFGKWEALREEPQPEQELIYPAAIWHYARGLAEVRLRMLDEARRHLGKIRAVANDDSAEEMDVFNPATALAIVRMAAGVLEGEIAAAEGDYEKAIKTLREAVEHEDNLGYREPPPWFGAVRRTLGAVLLEAGRTGAAEAVYREDLQRHPDNGWSLFGLYQAVKAQGRPDEAEEIHERYEQAWSRSDVELTSSRF